MGMSSHSSAPSVSYASAPDVSAPSAPYAETAVVARFRADSRTARSLGEVEVGEVDVGEVDVAVAMGPRP